MTPSALPLAHSPVGTSTPIPFALLMPLVANQSQAATPTPAPTATTHPYPLSSPTPPTASYPLGTAQPTERPAATPTPSLTPTRAHPVYSGPPLDRSEIGMQIHLHRNDVDQLLRHLRALNVGWVKVQISWKLFEPQPDSYDEVLLHELDLLISGSRSSDIYVLLSVAKAPDWSRSTTEMDGPPDDPAHFQNFMQFLAARYQGNVAAYELWNEANLRREWNNDTPLSAAGLVALIQAGAAGVHAGDPLAIVVSGAPAPTGIHDYREAVDDRIYLQEMLAAGVADVVDAIGAHPYGWSNPPDSTVEEPDPVAPTHNNHRSFFFRNTLWDYFDILNQAGYPEKQVWVTEFGWASFDGLDSAPPAGLEYMNAVSEWQQAGYTLRAFELAHEWRWVGPLFLWNLNFSTELGTEYAESGYSLLRPDGSPRPVYLALKSISQ